MSEQNTIDLSGKTALVTGGATRVGAAISRALQRAGAHVLIHYRSSAGPAESLRDELLARRPGSASLLQADLLAMAELERLAREAAAVTGQVDILINNASTYYPTPIGEATEVHWDDLLGSNAKAPFFLAQALAPQLVGQRGCVVNLVDIHAERPHHEHPIYSMAKAANAMLVKSLARELAPEVRVNGIAPGAILWPENFMEDEEKKAILTRIPLARPGTPGDIARTVLFLIDSPYITGQIIAVDGGRSVQQ